jgi:hypothetical protein
MNVVPRVSAGKTNINSATAATNQRARRINGLLLRRTGSYGTAYIGAEILDFRGKFEGLANSPAAARSLKRAISARRM